MRFSASVAGRLMACPASANLDVAIPNWKAPDVDPMAGAKGQGTRMHENFEPFYTLPAKEIQAAAKVLEYIGELRATRRFKVLVEQSVKAEWLDSAPTTTADLVFYVADEIHILDTKWGVIPVEVVENPQLMFYAACYGALAPKAKGVHVHILQPRIDNMGSWFIDATRLGQFMDEALLAEKKIAAKDTTFGPSDHCTFCPANPHSRSDKGSPLCPAQMAMLYPPIIHEDEILNL